jgi:serine/threonine protein phosphatase PrpC
MLSEPNKEFLESERGESHGIQWGVSSMQGWRIEMEDQHLIVPEIPGLAGHSLYAVFDGHGGKNAAIVASKELLNAIQKTSSFSSYVADQNLEHLCSSLKQAFLDVDSHMRELFHPRLSPNERSGCTAIAVVVTPTHIVTANAGDSRAALSRAGCNVELSFDHKPNNEVEKNRIEKAGGIVAMKRVDAELAVARAMGDFQFKDIKLPPENCKVTANPDLNIQVRTKQDEFIVVACDGVWDVMSNQECIDTVTRYCKLGESNPMLMSEELMEDCLNKGSRDNMSAVIVLFDAAQNLVAKDRPGIMALRAQREEMKAKAQQAKKK